MTTSAHKFDGLPIDNFLCDTRVRVRQEVKRMLKKLDYMLQTHKTNPQLQITIERDISVFRTFNRRLDKPSLISNTHWLKRASKRLRHMQTKYGLLLKRPRGPVKNQLINNTLQIMSERGKKARKACFIERIMLWLIYRRDWYPVFTTLTVREEHYAKVFAKDSDIWRNYVRSVRRAIELQVSGRVNRPGQHDPTAHEYTAVVERGGKHGRLHIHVLHMCRLLPAGTTDPNRRAANGTHREIQTFNKFWQYGFSSSIAVRTHTMDPYGKARLGMATSNKERPHSQSYLAGSNTKLARYMGKYLTKQESYEWKSTQMWRTRMTRGLGKELLTQLTSTLNQKQTEQMIHGNYQATLARIEAEQQAAEASRLQEMAKDILQPRRTYSH